MGHTEDARRMESQERSLKRSCSLVAAFSKITSPASR